MLRICWRMCVPPLIIADPFPVAQCDIADIFTAMLQRIAKIVRFYMSVPRAYSIRW